MPPVVLLDDVPVVRREHALVTSWPLLTGPDQRAPLLTAVRDGVVRLADIARVADAATRLRGRAELQALIRAVQAGCESELELWGYRHVFDVPGLRDARRQLPIRIGGRTYYLDMAFESERLAVELDGRAYHASPQQWERDIRRDLALATAGWQTIRLSHRRLTTDVDGCRRDVLRVLAARRRTLVR